MTKGLLHWKESGVSERHRYFKSEDSLTKEWTEKWEGLLKVLGTGIISAILGNRGSGKTQLAVCAIRETCKRNRTAKYVKSLDFFLDIRQTYKQKSEDTEHNVLKKYCEPFLLVVDAIENRSESDFENLLLNHLIDLRYDQCKDTILISNQSINEFSASMGISIVDRIKECGWVVVCNWKSFRGTK